MATIGVRGLADERANCAHAQPPLIDDCCKIVLRGAGQHIATLHQRKPSLVTPPPRSLPLGGVPLRECVAAQPFGRDGMCPVKNALENVPLGLDDDRHVQPIVSLFRRLPSDRESQAKARRVAALNERGCWRTVSDPEVDDV